MASLPSKLNRKLLERELNNAVRVLPEQPELIDFSSNDYLGLADSPELFNQAAILLEQRGIQSNGATGSRLLTGNHGLYNELENVLEIFHKVGAAVVFNSGYDANLGFFSSVPQRGDTVFYDEFIHASIRDGIKLGNAKSFKFRHNNLLDLKKKFEVERSRSAYDAVFYVVTESIFSMDGDSPDIHALIEFCRDHGCLLVVDEAHAVGIIGDTGEGLIQHLGFQDLVFARIITFGKALGSHGAAILGSVALKSYLVNFARSLIYTTAMPPHSLATINTIYERLPLLKEQRKKLFENIQFFKQEINRMNLETAFIESNSAIHCCVVPGNTKIKALALGIRSNGFDVRPIMSPTVPQGKERLRICLHAFNTRKEITELLQLVKTSMELL